MNKFSSALNVLGWSAYLACSWTWCIGLYLPVLLVRKFGFPAWPLFVIPNVLGAAAFGFIVSSPSSNAFTAFHEKACRWFSLVTIAFQCYFAGWAGRLLPPAGLGAVAALLAGLCFFSRRGGRMLSAIVWIITVPLLLAVRGETPPDFAPPAAGFPELVSLLLVCCFGFLLCPYLDLTFHHARRNLSGPGARAAFAFGFGALFLVVMLLSLSYAPAMALVFEGKPVPAGTFSPALIGILAAYIILQTGLTAVFHFHALDGSPLAPRPALAAVLAALPFAAGYLLPWKSVMGISLRELVYYGFMVFYAVIFPAYVYFRVLKPTTPGRLPAVLTAAALPFFTAAFLGSGSGRMTWALPGLALLLAGRLFARYACGCLPPDRGRQAA